jgi:hypothetical protein
MLQEVALMVATATSVSEYPDCKQSTSSEVFIESRTVMVRQSTGAMSHAAAFVQALSQRVQASATKVLTAVDWPPTEPPATGDVAKSSSTTDGSSNHAVADRNSDIVGANDNSGTDVLGDKAKTAAAVKQHSSRIQRSSAEIRSEDGSSISWAAQLGVFRFAAQDWAESLWQVLDSDLLRGLCGMCDGWFKVGPLIETSL